MRRHNNQFYCPEILDCLPYCLHYFSVNIAWKIIGYSETNRIKTINNVDSTFIHYFVIAIYFPARKWPEEFF